MAEQSFRPARPDERALLDGMTLAGVRYWEHDVRHPEAYAGLVAALADAEGVEDHRVTVLDEDGEVLAFHELVDRGDHVELTRMFIRVDLIGQGYGRRLWGDAVVRASTMADRMLIMSDPEAIGFYAAMGAELEREVEVAPGFALGRFWYDLHGPDLEDDE